MPKLKSHNEWFMPLAKTRKSCPECDYSNADKSSVRLYAWGEYHAARWYKIQEFCEACFPMVIARLANHAQSCGCGVQYCVRSGYRMPEWFFHKVDNAREVYKHRVR